MFRRVATASGWLNGARLPDSVYDPPLYFADQHWKNPDRKAYMRALEQHKPTMATVLDLEREEQLPEVLSWAEEASQFCGKVIIIPKVSGIIEDLPRVVNQADVILGYSVPTSYGGTEVPLWEFNGWPVHLLGGSPQKQMDLAEYMQVVSCDGNMAHQQAHRCRFWSRIPGRKGHWRQLSEVGDFRSDKANVEAFRLSCLEIAEAWRRRFASCQHA